LVLAFVLKLDSVDSAPRDESSQNPIGPEFGNTAGINFVPPIVAD